jgi:GAF domain-containing protein
METTLTDRDRPRLASPAELQEGIARLSRGSYFREASLEMALSILTESAARMSGVERVSIWAPTGDQRELRCLELYELSPARHGSSDSLQASHYPAYFNALRSESCIVADDACRHPATAEFATGYLARHRISAVLDTPIHIRGEFQGVLSFEQVGTREPWSPAHRLFAHAIANLVTLALVEHEAAEARLQVKSAAQRLRTLFGVAGDTPGRQNLAFSGAARTA